jgi:hypothetical protein
MLDYIRELVQMEPRVLATVDVPALARGERFRPFPQLVVPDCSVTWIGPSTVHGLRYVERWVVIGDLRAGALSMSDGPGASFYPVPPRQGWHVEVGPAFEDVPAGTIHVMGWNVPCDDSDLADLFWQHRNP